MPTPGPVATVTPSDFSVFGDLRAALEASLDEPVRVILADLTGPARCPEPTAEDLRWLSLYALPTVAALGGSLAGASAAIALACDIRVADPTTMLELRDSPRLASLLGGRPAPASPVAATAAFELGLLSTIAPRGGALAGAQAIAATIASRGPIAVQLGKEAIWRGLEMPVEHALRFETDLTLLLQTTKDRAEGVSAFLEKRQPRFTGE